MDLFKILQKYFNTKVEKISNKNNILLEIAKILFIEGFIESNAFDDRITVNFQREVTYFNNKKKNCLFY